MKIFRRVLAVLAAALCLLLAGLWWTLQRSVPPLSGRETLAGLSAPADVVFDSLAIPHIVASTENDAVRVLGYLHARDRLWAMEVMRRAAEGRFAEVLGARAVETDRFLRSLDIPHVAHLILQQSSPESRAVVDAYVGGVNEWIARKARPLGPEFRLLGVAPEPWTAQQVVEVARVMSWDLANASAELELARAQARLGLRVKDLFPWVPDTGAVILPRGSGTWSAGAHRPRSGGRTHERTMGDVLPSAHLAMGQVPVIPPLAAEVMDAVAMSRASNSWVIGPGRSRSGKPLLANDPHLTLRAPALWYLAAIETPTLTVAGATIPGLPAVVLGRNRRIAWGLTNIEADDLDYVIERLSADSSKVQSPEGWVAVEIVRDSIRVKGARAESFTLIRTPDGPIVGADPSGVARDSGGTVRALAMRWVGSEPSDDLAALMQVGHAGTWDEFLRAVAGWKSPEQNWVYADVDGNIGYTASGNIPVRRSGQGLLPTPGWTGEGAWERYLSFAELPRAFNPPEGFIVTANNRIAGPEYPFFVTASPALPYRAERIREMILAKPRLDAEDVRRMQMDTVDLFARWAKAIAARAADSAGRVDVAAALRAWDGTAGSDRTEPAIFFTWYRALQRMTYEDDSPGYAPNSPLQHWMSDGASPWFDDVRTPQREDLAALSLAAMREALRVTHGRRWGEIHTTVSRHALGGIRALDLLLGLNVGPRPRAGSLYTVDVADFGRLEPPFVNSHGPSFRQVVDLADMEGGRVIITSGQSGNPWSRHYRDQRDRWWKGELWGLPLSHDRVATLATLRLTGGP
jgi:penicillin amidase